MPSLNSQLQDTRKMLASVCIWLAMPRICEQREDARVWGTQLESAWSTNSTATFAPELPTVQVSAYSM